jgi:hypothetical protein
MRSRGSRVLFLIGCVALVVIGVVALPLPLIGWYRVAYTAQETCLAEPIPPGAAPYEAAFAGSGSVGPVVVGTVCTWNRTEGGTFATFVPEWDVTAFMLLGLVPLGAGIAGLVVDRRRRMPERPAKPLPVNLFRS